MSAEPLVVIDDLKIDVRLTRANRLPIVDTATFSIDRGEIIGLIGESGSGKTMLCRALVGTLGRRGAYIAGGKLTFDGIDLVTAKGSAWADIRGKRIGYVPQSALAGPNPVMTIGAQLEESILQDKEFSKGNVKARAIELLNIVQIRRPEVVMHQYQHELSGGMKQRVMIACAIAQQPELIVADEPTTGLDVTVQAEIMRLLLDIRSEFKTSIILVSHDLPLVNQICDEIVVMHAGSTVEKISSRDITRANHPYTRALYDSRIDLVEPKGELTTINGQPPTVGNWPVGCRFSERCNFVEDRCRLPQVLPIIPIGPNGFSTCLRFNELEK
ncbi:MAG: ABC transporter ATP-binding protein [Actinobacteria bacterium]|nr:ABC transporter ATP-binding protein [Actinomycetota bacterium]